MKAASAFWGDCYDKEGRRDEGTSVAEEGAAEEEVMAAATAKQGAGAADCPMVIKKRRSRLRQRRAWLL
ncbi:hypothetical protein BHM03_00058607 [Ensete ventricosum]|uniref:Uncharacterized protein n=1 Tax=Ensete ventricosum TaxID=4639 RepID=A0A445MML1_ENSVE|nr:hypothetical protein BHM03_00058607 [Ensete ventricosum]